MTFFLNYLELLCEVLTLIILLRSLMSRITPEQTNFFTNLLYQFTEPMLAPLRRILPRWMELDLSPFVLIVILQVIIVIKHIITLLLPYYLSFILTHDIKV